jgi:hypothetical protein
MPLTYGTTQTAACTSFNSLASSTTTGVANSATITVGTSANVADHMVTVQITVGAHTPSSTTNIYVWAVAYADGTNNAGAQSGTVEDFNDGDAAESIDVDGNNMVLLGYIHCHTASVVYRSRPFFIAQAFKGLPPKYSIVIQNQTGTALAASGHAVEYREISY